MDRSFFYEEAQYILPNLLLFLGLIDIDWRLGLDLNDWSWVFVFFRAGDKFLRGTGVVFRGFFGLFEFGDFLFELVYFRLKVIVVLKFLCEIK